MKIKQNHKIVYKVVEETRQHVKLECGCLILFPKPDVLDILQVRIPEPIWIRCPQHKNAKPEEIIIQRK